MGSIRSWYEEIRDYFFIGLIVLGISLVAILGHRSKNDYSGTVDRILESQLELSRSLGDLVSGLSDLEGRLNSIDETVDDIRDIQSGIDSTVKRLEEGSYKIGDSSTDLGITADRLYRVNRELKTRFEEAQTE